jgi:hypothetical protein
MLHDPILSASSSKDLYQGILWLGLFPVKMGKVTMQAARVM